MRQAKSPAELGFTGHDRRRLRKALRGCKEVRAYRRIQGVLLVAEGRPATAVATITAASVRTVYQWVAWYLREHRVEILRDMPKPGRSRAAEAITGERIERELKRDPLKLGYSTTVWTVALLATHLGKRYDCAITERTLRRRMKGLDLRWKRSRYVFSEKDPHRTQKKGLLSGF